MGNKICPICSSSKNRCATKVYNGINRYFCKGTNVSPPGFHYIGQSSTTFSMFIEDTDYNSLNHKSISKNTQVVEPQIDLTNRLSVSQRDHELHKLINNGLLADTHKKSLLRRGLTTNDITRFGFVSLVNNRKYDVDFIGFRDGCYRGANGFIVPITNGNGQKIGFQVATLQKEIKYIWTTDKILNIGQHLVINNTLELPVQVVNRGGETWVCEGILKPIVASIKHSNCSVIGASGGHFVRCEGDEFRLQHQVKDAIDKLGNTEVKIQLDAGSIANRNIVLAMSRLADALIANGNTPVFGDWGQWLSKDSFDIDEISSATKIVYRSYDYFKDEVEKQNEAVSDSILDLSQELTKNFIKTTTTRKDAANVEFADSIKIEPGKTYQFEANDRPRLIEKLVRNYPGKYILDNSETGSGKTYSVSQITPSALVYHASEDSIESPSLEYFSLEPNKVKEDLSEFARYSPRNADNCKKSVTMAALQGTHSTIKGCGECPFLNECRTTEGQYLHSKISTKKSNKRFGHLLAVKNDTPNRNNVVIVDEAGVSLKLIGELKIDRRLLHQMHIFLSHCYQDAKVASDLGILLKIVDELYSLIHIESEYGLGSTDIISRLMNLGIESINLELLQEAIDALNLAEIKRVKFKKDKDSHDVALLTNFFPMIQRLMTDKES
ncbi:MAG: hypothetical protein ACRDBG_10050, partial [Waterburya sp.]